MSPPHRNVSAPSALFAPRVLPLHLLLLLRREIVLDIEADANLLGRLALDFVGHRLARQIKERLDVKVVGRKDEVEESLVVNLHKIFVPIRLLVLRQRLLLRLV
eukprot:190339-Prymnesium_polylepis.1